MDESYDELWDVEWVLIPGEKYIMKYKFQDDGYILLVTNFCQIYGENLSEKDVLEKFCVINPYAEMKPKVILSKIKHSLESYLASKENEIRMQSLSNSLKFQLEFTVSQVSFFFDLNPQMLSAENLRTHVIAPTVLSSFLSFQENNNLNKKLEDSESKISSPQKSRIDPKSTDVLSTLSKKSKIDVKDVLESFLQSQKNMLKYINESKNHIGKTKTIESSEIRKTEILLPTKRDIDSEETNSSNIKYEDKPNINIKEEEDSENSSSFHQINPKLKKKKTFKI